MNLKTILGWLALAFVAWWAISRPTDAQHVVSNIGHFLTAAVHGTANFFTSI